MTALQLSEDQIRWFRARRGHLAGPGAPDPVAAARDLLGAQSQVLAPSLHAIALRTAGSPTAEALKARMFGDQRSLVRTWGPRETVHLYDPADWRLVVAARGEWSRAGRQGMLATDAMLDEAVALARGLEAPADRRGLLPAVREDFVRELTSIAEKSGQEPAYFASGRLVFGLSMRGDICTGIKRGSTQTYPLRERWYPDLPWPAMDAREANLALTRRYLSLCGPATPQDVAHYFGAKVSSARAWLAELEGELLTVRCGELTLRAMQADEDALRQAVGDWPLRLMPQFDTLLMGHADKRWTAPVEAERKQIWKTAARVCATVLRRGVIVGTWTHKARKRDVTVTVTPLTGWSKALLPEVEVEARALAAHLGRQEARVIVG